MPLKTEKVQNQKTVAQLQSRADNLNEKRHAQDTEFNKKLKSLASKQEEHRTRVAKLEQALKEKESETKLGHLKIKELRKQLPANYVRSTRS